jgi:hypothetical protein
VSTPANPDRPRSWKNPRRISGSPLLRQRGRGWGWGQTDKVPLFPRAGVIITATRRRTARELWDLLSPTSTAAAQEVCRSVAGSKAFVRSLAIERPPHRARWKNALRFTSLGPVIAFMYFFYLLVALAITIPVLVIAFCLDLPGAIKSLLRRYRRRRKSRP